MKKHSSTEILSHWFWMIEIIISRIYPKSQNLASKKEDNLRGSRPQEIMEHYFADKT